MNAISEITSKTETLGSISIIMLVSSIAFLMAAIVIWFVLDIPHSIRVLTGFGTNRDITKLNQNSKQGKNLKTENIKVKAALNWNTSGRLDLKKNEHYGSEETQLLEETVILMDKETEVLNSSTDDFEIEEDIIITGTEEKI